MSKNPHDWVQNDAITSKYIPLAMATVGGALFLDGAYKMYLGRGKKEGF